MIGIKCVTDFTSRQSKIYATSFATMLSCNKDLFIRRYDDKPGSRRSAIPFKHSAICLLTMDYLANFATECSTVLLIGLAGSFLIAHRLNNSKIKTHRAQATFCNSNLLQGCAIIDSMKKVIPATSVLIPDEARAIFHGQIFDAYQWSQALFDGSNHTFEMLKRPDTVVAICIVDDEKIL